MKIKMYRRPRNKLKTKNHYEYEWGRTHFRFGWCRAGGFFAFFLFSKYYIFCVVCGLVFVVFEFSTFYAIQHSSFYYTELGGRTFWTFCVPTSAATPFIGGNFASRMMKVVNKAESFAVIRAVVV